MIKSTLITLVIIYATVNIVCAITLSNLFPFLLGSIACLYLVLQFIFFFKIIALDEARNNS